MQRPGRSEVKASACNAGDLGREDPLEKGMATHSSILAWETPRTKETGRLQSMGMHRSDMTEQLIYIHRVFNEFEGIFPLSI